MGAAVAALRRRPIAVAALLLAAVAAVGWASLTGYVWTDYEAEAELPLRHLVAGELGLFAQTAPGYGGSFVIRAPFAFLPSLWGGDDVAVYRAMAAPCLLGAAALGLALWRERMRRFPGGPWALVVALLAAANPVTLRALEIGHPEDLLGAALCAGAVLAAVRGRPWPAALLLGLAMGNKAWAVLAVGPVLVAIDGGWWQRARVLALAGTVAAVVMAPFLLDATAASRATTLASETSTIFQPWQAWWFVGDTGDVVRGSDGQVKPGYRTPPSWLSPVSHPLIALTVVPLTLLWLWRRRGARRGRPEDALLLLALLMLVRCVLDPWNISYYHLPFLLALLSWEALRFARPPVLTLLATCTVWLTFERLPHVLPADAQAAAYLACALPALLLLARAAFGGSGHAVQDEREAERVAPARREHALAR